MITGDPKIPIENIRRHTALVLGEDMEVPDIKAAALKDDSGLYGAMALLGMKD
jgi:hypothetical protein